MIERIELGVQVASVRTWAAVEGSDVFELP
jgi:hypothetical protein